MLIDKNLKNLVKNFFNIILIAIQNFYKFYKKIRIMVFCNNN